MLQRRGGGYVSSPCLWIEQLVNVTIMENKITRRDALKRIGAAVLGGAALSSGLLPLTSCAGEKKKRVILYFTGTGNCLYIARELGGEDAELLSIPQLVR